MGIFTIIVLIPIIAVCALLAAACLMLTKQPLSFISVTIFTFTGGLIGLITMMVWCSIFANEEGTLESTAAVLGMFAVSGVLAAIGGLYCSSLYTKKTK